MNVESIMTREVTTVGMDETLEALNNIFSRVNFHHLLVVEGGKLRGVISDRDVLRMTSPFLNTPSEQARDLMVLKKKAHQIMTREVLSISKEQRLESAVNMMISKKISCLPVVSESGEIEGILTLKDLVKTLMRELGK
jgi:acetoin utilization protein AcuB